jgi:hypothetical protein
MRRLLLAAAVLAVPTVASAQYYATPYAGPYAAPGVAVTTPGVTVTAPAAPLVQGQVYLAPGATYVAPGQQYSDQPIIIEGRRYYRDCWWDWGQRRCELKPWF